MAKMSSSRKKNPKKEELKKDEYVGKYREKWDSQTKRWIYVNVAGQEEAREVLLLVIFFLIIGTVGFLLGTTILYNSNNIYLANVYEVYSYVHKVFQTPLEDPIFKGYLIWSLSWSEAEISLGLVYLILPLVFVPVSIGYIRTRKRRLTIGVLGGAISVVIGGVLLYLVSSELYDSSESYLLHAFASYFLLIIGILILILLVLERDKEQMQREIN
ncbi:MAG: hypothetical protein ACETWM_09700 [Candidatus Lokiarchaeia archaeon]